MNIVEQHKIKQYVLCVCSTRVRFMLDTLSAVKNNNVLKISNYDPSYVEHLKKIQKSLLRPGKYVTELKISLDDLLNGIKINTLPCFCAPVCHQVPSALLSFLF